MRYVTLLLLLALAGCGAVSCEHGEVVITRVTPAPEVTPTPCVPEGFERTPYGSGCRALKGMQFVTPDNCRC